jgi:hypothetical protein
MRSGEYGNAWRWGTKACFDSRQSHLFNETLVICVKECSSNISFGGNLDFRSHFSSFGDQAYVS